MPGLEDVLGQKPKGGKGQNDALQEGQSEAEGRDQENPLKKIQEAKGKPSGKAKASLDSDELGRILMTGENSNGMITDLENPEEEDGVKLHEEPEDKPKVEGGKAESKGKYKDLFKEDMFKHPDKYFIETPEGRMTIAEAMRKGYNPITRNFEESKSRDAIVGEATRGLNESDKATVDRMLDPASAQVAEGDASKYGLDADSPMIRRPMPEQQAQGQPPIPQQGEASGAPNAIGAQIPGGEGEASNPLAALLGGGR